MDGWMAPIEVFEFGHVPRSSAQCGVIAIYDAAYPDTALIMLITCNYFMHYNL